MLKIKNPTDILGMNFVGGKYTLKEAEEHSDRYTFAFKDRNTNWAIIHIYRNPEWDSEHNRNMYRVDNGAGRDHRVSAKWFGMIKNVQFTFNEALKEL
jgi:hypothetical protein